jgi:Flp pilus assembly protein TadB
MGIEAVAAGYHPDIRRCVQEGAEMLSERERQLLNQIETSMSLADPRFVAAMRKGRPRAPREYKRFLANVLVALGFILCLVVILTGHPLAAAGFVTIVIIGLVQFVRRRLDEPPH